MNSGRIWRANLMTAVVASASVYVPAALAQSAPSNAELAHLVKQQAQQIKRLNARIDQLEKNRSRQAQTQKPSGRKSAPEVAQERPPKHTPQTSAPARQKPAKTTYARHEEQGKANLKKRVSKLEKERVKVDWSKGAPKFSSPDGEHTFKIGGRLQYDFSSTFGSGYDDRNITGTEFRRVRLGAKGKIIDPILYEVQADFAGGEASLTYAYLAFQHEFELGKGTLYLGNYFADRGLDARTSSKWTWFTERNTVANAIAALSSYDLGATSVFVGKDNWHTSLGIYKGSASSSKHTDSDDLAIISRAHWDPIYLENDKLLHIGANGSYERYHDKDEFQKNTNIGTHYNSNLRISSDAVGRVDGKGYRLQSSHSYGVELAGLYGPFALGAEWGQRFIETHHGPTMGYSAYSAQVGYSLTGEPFGYSKDLGIFTHPEVENPVFKGGWGTWQLVARYQGLEFENSQQFHGGSGHGTSVGLDWYLNDWVRGIMEYTRWHTNNNGNPVYRNPVAFYGGDGGNTVNARIQIAF